MDEQKSQRRHPASGLTKHPREVNRDHLIQIVLALYCWGFSTKKLLLLHLKTTATSRLVDALVERGLVREIEVWLLEALHVYMLTPSGLDLALAHFRGQPHAYELGPRKMVKEDRIRHELAVQGFSVSQPGTTEVIPDRPWLGGNGAKGKRPDCLAVYPDGTKIAIEVEKSEKRRRELDESLSATLAALEARLFSSVLYVSPWRSLLQNYAEVLHDPSGLRRWAPDARGHYREVSRVLVPVELRNKFDWLHKPTLLEDFT